MTTTTTVSVILDALHSGQDGSVHAETGHVPTKGYMVGGVSWTMVVSPELVDHYTILDFLSAHKAVLSWDNYYVGWWEHKGRIYFDVSQNISDRDSATEMGKLRGEIAIWDLDNSCEIPTS